MSRTIGIDFGTTNSVISVISGGEPIVITGSHGMNFTPSIVAISKNGEYLVGQPAKRQAITNSENTVQSIKRFMGQKYYTVMDGKQYSPPEIAARILQKLKTDAEVFLGEKVTRAVITVPAHCNEAQRHATKDAGTIAGLNVLTIIDEPTAAALAYGLNQKKDESIAVYSIGGGFFGMSILDIGEGTFQVKSTAGDTHLGGDDFDQRIIDWICDEFKREHGIELREDKMVLQRLKEASETAKIELSTIQQTDINLPFITVDANGPKNLNIMLTRAKFEQLTVDLIDKTLEVCKQAVADAGKTNAQIDEVILVGGQTRMPLVQHKVKQFFGKEPNKSVNPDEVAAMGAAILAGVLKGDIKEVLLLDVTPLTLGIETLGGVMTPLISLNTTIPTSKSQFFSTATDSQPSVEIHILQGEYLKAANNLSLGWFALDGILPAPHGMPQIEVTFDIDANGILSVKALDKGTGKEVKFLPKSSDFVKKNNNPSLLPANINTQANYQGPYIYPGLGDDEPPCYGGNPVNPNPCPPKSPLDAFYSRRKNEADIEKKEEEARYWKAKADNEEHKKWGLK